MAAEGNVYDRHTLELKLLQVKELYPIGITLQTDTFIMEFGY